MTRGRGSRGPNGPRLWSHSFLLLYVLLGCASGRALSPFESSQRTERVVLRVENRNIHDATLYLMLGRERLELGTSQGQSLQFMEFAWPVGQPLTMEIQLEVGERYRPPPFPILGGGRLQLTIAGELRRSGFSR